MTKKKKEKKKIALSLIQYVFFFFFFKCKMILISFLENFLLISLFGLTFGSILVSQFWFSELVVYPQQTAAQSIIWIPILAVFAFVFTGIGVWFVNDVLFSFAWRSPPLPKTNEKGEEDDYYDDDGDDYAAACESSPFVSSTPSLLLLAIIWIFCAYSRLSEFAVALIGFTFAGISFLMVEFYPQKRGERGTGEQKKQRRREKEKKFNLVPPLLKNWISCNLVAFTGTAVLLYGLKMNTNFGCFGLSSTSLLGVAPLWTPSLLLMMTTSWGQVCRRVFAL